MNLEMSWRRRLLVTAASVLLLAAGLYVLVAKPFRTEGLRVTGSFGRAGQGLDSSSPVKIRGVTVGTVSSIRLDDDGRVTVALRLRPGVRVPGSATAAIEPASAFGPKFVDLVPGAGEAHGPYLADGGRIARTSDPKDLADLLGSADATVRAIDPADVSTIVHTLAVGLDGQGTRLRSTIDHTDEILRVAYRRRSEAREFLGDGADLSETLARSAGDIVAVSGDTNAVIASLADGREGRLGDFADQIAQVSALLSHGFDKRGDQLGEAFRTGERATSVIYSQLGLYGDAVRSANRLLPVYGALTKVPGPGGKHYVAAQVFLPSNPCELLIGLCPGGGG
ncbi:MCE family protein [Actinomadura sp. DC4]|uniref:MCE family protein n=1 Tax=Actinomadura sp. DC4 TaxID=3055069 RepID=UPI0025B0E5C3|nr:MCE family protein [Actinomadura sp. DC4]MDN3351305.1 MCE family protein [Actinomadura sp. DC4]